ncbi:(E3-independent) E2 ubiquitin-conjugating enzyme [Lucilia cuprina]|nr:(E3-independent) E2 ubiquitin-conjugating enzyme [Lucilia cuprina]
METEVVTSTANDEESNNLKNNANNIVQSINKEFTNIENSSEQHNNESSSETSSNETKLTKNKSGASPKLLAEENHKSTTNSPHKSVAGQTRGDDSSLTPGDCQYFFEDEIFRIDKKGRVKFGLVLETPGTYSGDEDDEFDEILDKGEIRVVWYPEFKETIQSENSIGLADRTLMPGDVVRRLVPGKETQRGYCRDINMKADVKVLGTKYVIKNVNAERLRVISNWQRDGAVCLDSWVGSTKDVEEKAILRTASGCRIEISSNDFYNFQDLNSHRQRDIFNPKVFYPGNTIIGSLPPMENIKILTPDIPLHTNKKGKPLTRKFTIERLYTDSVWVNWQCKALSDDTNLEDITLQPNPCVTGEDLKRLKRLNLFESCMLQIVDRNYLTYSSCDTLVKKSDWDKEQAVKFKQILQQQKEDNQKIFVRTSFTGSTGTAGTHHHYEKFKKKLSLSLDDKTSNKLKRSLFKGDKLGKRETSQEMSQQEKLTPKSNKDTEAEWFSTEDEADIDEDKCDINAMDIDNFVENLKQYTEDCISTTTTMSTCSSPSPHTSPKHLTKRQLKKKTRKNFKKPFLSEPCTEFNPKEGDELVTEALLVYSTATVVWQDGTIESNIPSTQLYPIHHLDNHEFFPGDFVISAKEEHDFSHRDYGVIQTVDHQGRIAHVKWFTTYTSADEPKPTYKGETECSVYDLKDQPDFQYRPGTMVIRVANFVGEDANCTAGQVIDNYIDGRVKVWWVDGHISLCWPQDLFEVGQLDQGDLSHASEDSWETESENSEVGCGGGSSLKLSIAESHILTNIEKARVALARLQEIFNISPNLQNPEVMRKLLSVYKSCRFLDRLLNTNFFHEDNFMGLIERVRKIGSQSMHERVQDQKNRLFSETLQASSPSPNKHQHQYSAIVLSLAGVGKNTTVSGNTENGNGAISVPINNVHKVDQSLSQPLENASTASSTTTSKEFAPRILFTISSTPFKCPNSHNHNTNSSAQLTTPSSLKRRSSPAATSAKETLTKKTEDVPTTGVNITDNEKHFKCDNITPQSAVESLPSAVKNLSPQMEISPNKNKQYNTEKNQLLNSVMMNIEKAFEKTSHLTAASQDDSGNYSRNENCDGSSTSYTSSSDLTNVDTNNSLTKANDNQKSINQSSSSIELTEEVPELVCVRLCSLLNEQLVKCLNEISEKYYKDDQPNLNDVIIKDDETIETIIDIEDNKESLKTLKTKDDGVKISNVVAATNGVAETTTLEPSTDVSILTPAADVQTTFEAGLNQECFQVLSNAPKNHKYQLTIFHPNNTQLYYKAVQREHRMLKTSLPPGVYVKVYEDRMDLLSVMIEGPKHTPYEDGMFFFDIQLGRDYPKNPPLCHYISYCSDRLNPNLYEDGKVCVSLLGTWMGKDSEVWGPNSTLLQVIVSIQGLILVPEPYFNEAGYEKQKGTQQGKENSRMYNEMVIIKMVQATTKLIQNPPEIFRDEIQNHYKQNGLKMYERIKGWMELSKQKNSNTNEENVKQNQDTIENVDLKYTLPHFPLVPASRGFCLTLAGLLESFKQRIISLNETTETTPAIETTTNATTIFE